MTATKTKYEVWGRKDVGRGKRVRLAFGLPDEAQSRIALEELKTKGYEDVVIVQRPSSYGKIPGLQRRGRT